MMVAADDLLSTANDDIPDGDGGGEDKLHGGVEVHHL